MAVIKCKMCGGDLNITEGESVAECEYCGSRQTVPAIDDEKKLTLFARANRLRLACEFDKASGVYESIVAEFPEEAEAYWGLVLCKYGIEYVDDPSTGKKIPTCHRSSFDSVMEDSDFEQACENADSIARKVYRQEAKQIEELRKGILEVSGKEEPYDIFICYKETDEKGDRTLDSVLAQDIYDTLTDKGYRVFFSRITLEDKLGQEYEPYIFAALNSAKIMLAVGTDYEYYNAVWVKNEWSRYLKLMEKEKSKHLIPCYKNLDAYDMPKEFARLQAQDVGKVGAMQDLIRGIDKILGMQNAQPAVTAQSTDLIGETLKKAYAYLNTSSWDSAKLCLDTVRGYDPDNVPALIGQLMLELEIPREDGFEENKELLDEREVFQKAVKFADEREKKKLEKYRRCAVYNLSSSMLHSKSTAELTQAIQLLEPLDGWQDSHQKLEELRENLITVKRVHKKRKRIIITSVTSVLLLTGLLVGFLYLKRAYLEPLEVLRQAEMLFEDGKHQDAEQIFIQNSQYLDLLKEDNLCRDDMYALRFQNAEALLGEEEYDAAYAIFKKMGDYPNAENMASETLYRQGVIYYEQEVLDLSREFFARIPSYKDSKEYIGKIDTEFAYQKCIMQYSLHTEKECKKAISGFVRLGNYKDSASYVKKALLKLTDIYYKGEKYLKAVDYTRMIAEKGSAAASEILEEIQADLYAQALQHFEQGDMKAVREKLYPLKKYAYKDSEELYVESYRAEND